MKATIAVVTVLLCAALAAPAFPANDMIGVSWGGSVYLVDSGTGTGTLLAASGYTSLNSMAVDGTGTVYVVAKGGTLLTIDTTTGAATAVGSLAPSIVDVRGMAFHPSGLLYAVTDGSPDTLWTVDVKTLAATMIGPTGVNGIQGFACDSKGTLYAWDVGPGSGIGVGLMTVNATTGLATDINPAVGNQVNCQFLTVSPKGVLYGGNSSLYTLDPATGIETLVGSGGFSDLRGCDFMGALLWTNYGAGYPGANGIPTIALDANPLIGTQPNLLVGSSAVAIETSILFLGLTKAQVMGFWHGELLLVPVASAVLPIPPAGYTLPLPIPNTPSLVGFKVLFQSLQADPGATYGASSTPGLEMTIGM